MARTKGFFDSVPQTYRGVEVCDHVAYRWTSYEGIMWRMGVDNALDAVLATVEAEAKNCTGDGTQWFPSEWEIGMIEGKERAAESFVDAMDTYKKESN